jgi:hypothetical protein
VSTITDPEVPTVVCASVPDYSVAISGYLPSHFSLSQGVSSPECPGDSCPHRGCLECGFRWETRTEGVREIQHCGRCHASFGSESTFDLHQVRGSCLDAATCGRFLRGRLGGVEVWRKVRSWEENPWKAAAQVNGASTEGAEAPTPYQGASLSLAGAVQPTRGAGA